MPQQQLGQYAQVRGVPLGNAGLANGVLAGPAAGIRAGGLGGLNVNPALTIRPAVDRAAAPGLGGLANLAAANPANMGLQNYTAQNALATALGSQTLANLQARAGLNPNNLQARAGLNPNNPMAGINLLQQGAAAGINPSQDLLAIIGKQRQPVQGGAAGGFNAAQLGSLGVAAAANFGGNAQAMGSVVPSSLQVGCRWGVDLACDGPQASTVRCPVSRSWLRSP